MSLTESIVNRNVDDYPSATERIRELEARNELLERLLSEARRIAAGDKRVKLIPESELPKARLELRWVRLEEPDENGYTARCDYDIVIPLWRLDIRGEVYDDEYNLLERKTELRRSLGGTFTNHTGSFIQKDGKIRTPFRDHSHIAWDAFSTGLPAFVVAEGMAMPIEAAKELPQ